MGRGRGFLEARRAFEDEVLARLDDGRRTGREVSVLVGTVMGLAPVRARFGDVGVEEAVLSVVAVAEEMVPDGKVRRIGSTEIAVLVVGGDDEARDARRRITVALDVTPWQPGIHIGLACAIGTSSTPESHVDLVWRTADHAFRMRASGLQRGLDQLIGDVSDIGTLVGRLLDVGIDMFDLDALRYEVGGRHWSRPSPAPEEKPTGTRPLITSSHALIGSVAWWSRRLEGDVPIGLDEVLIACANAIERTLAIESSEGRARRDALTGLLNRDGLAHAMREVHAPYAVGVVDIDNFKLVNDRHGHEIGDRCLRSLAELLASARSSDLVARWGGEELVVVIPGTTAEGAAAALRRLLDRAMETIVVDGTPLSFSAGVAGVEDELHGVLDGIRSADMAMYEAKRQGRCRVLVAAALD